LKCSQFAFLETVSTAVEITIDKLSAAELCCQGSSYCFSQQFIC